MIFNNFNVIGKKYVQTSVSDANRENSNPRVNGKARFRHYPFTLGLGFLCLHQRPMLDSICLLGLFWKEKKPQTYN